VAFGSNPRFHLGKNFSQGLLMLTDRAKPQNQLALWSKKVDVRISNMKSKEIT